MKVTVNNKEVRVYWKHNNFSGLDSRQKYNGSTECVIQEFGASAYYGFGTAYCIKADNFNKSKGRIVSLTKAIKHLPKDVRTLFWNQYKKEINF